VWFLGTAPGIFGLASSGLGADLGPNSQTFGWILKSFPGPFSSDETRAPFKNSWTSGRLYGHRRCSPSRVSFKEGMVLADLTWRTFGLGCRNHTDRRYDALFFEIHR
jgi:hypothetical protein